MHAMRMITNSMEAGMVGLGSNRLITGPKPTQGLPSGDTRNQDRAGTRDKRVR
jgi:hypothetical protein